MIDRRLSHLRAVGRIGEGGRGVMHRAEDEELERHGLVQLEVLGAINLHHSAAADEIQDPVPSGQDRAVTDLETAVPASHGGWFSSLALRDPIPSGATVRSCHSIRG